ERCQCRRTCGGTVPALFDREDARVRVEGVGGRGEPCGTIGDTTPRDATVLQNPFTRDQPRPRVVLVVTEKHLPRTELDRPTHLLAAHLPVIQGVPHERSTRLDTRPNRPTDADGRTLTVHVVADHKVV